MNCKALKQTIPFLKKRWGSEQAAAVLNDAQAIYAALCAENKADPKAVKKHTEQNLFPCLSLYKALQQNGIAPGEALSFLDRVWSERAKADAAATAKLLHFAGLYKLYPALFEKTAKTSFGPAAGFSATFYQMGKGRCKFDMTKCLFYDTCCRYHCPELTQCFCHVDDINNAGLHPRLCWNRTQFMGGGADFCDFDIFVTDFPNSKTPAE